MWDVELSDFESSSLLSKDLEAYAKRLKRKVHAPACSKTTPPACSKPHPYMQ